MASICNSYGLSLSLSHPHQPPLPQCSLVSSYAWLLCCCYSVTKSCLTPCDAMGRSTPGFPVLYHLSEFAHTHVHWVGDAIQLSQPLLPLFLLPSVFPSIRVFASESALRIRWPKYWSFSFGISPSDEYQGWFPLGLTGLIAGWQYTALTYSLPNFKAVHCFTSGSNCCFLTCTQVSQEADKVVWYSHLFKNFPQFVVIHTVKGFGVVNKTEVDVFPGTLSLFQ